MRIRVVFVSLAVILAMPAVATTAAPASAAPAGQSGARGLARVDGTAVPSAVPDPYDAVPPSAPDRNAVAADRYIVVLRADADPTKVSQRHAKRDGLKADRLFSKVLRGFSAKLSKAQRTALAADPAVTAVVPDEIVETAGQLMPTGVSRIGARVSQAVSASSIDGGVDADVAIVDTGIDPSHPDLNVVGGRNCTSSNPAAWRDDEGHGTHVAGTVGAIDNGIGVVGVAPGVRLWAVKILGSDGSGLLSWYVCGLDWIAAQRDPDDPSRPLIEAVNMSVTKWGSDDGACGTINKDVLHLAICRVVDAGVTVVAAAANDSGPASKRVPASYNEVITVSALADTDGKPGGLGGHRCWSWGTYDRDDTFADFSNYGSDVDLIAPGKCIWSTLPGNHYGYSSGTSMAAPHVTGAAALFKVSRPWATPADVKRALISLGTYAWRTSTDPDGSHERLLDVSRLGPVGDFSLEFTPPTATLSQAGGTWSVPFRIHRDIGFLDTVSLAVTAEPAIGAALPATTMYGLDATTGSVDVTIPPGTPLGTYTVSLQGTFGEQVRTAELSVVVEPETRSTYVPLEPVRLLDTRTGNGLAGTFVSRTPRSVQVAGRGGVPAGASAVTVNLTVTRQTSGGYVALTTSPTVAPSTSTINFPRGDSRANGVTVPLGPDGTLSAVFVGAPGAVTDLVLDVTGYFTR